MIKMFERIQRHGMLATEDSLKRTLEAVGQPLRTFEAYAQEFAAKLLAK